jgi:hypothetical protein
LQQFCAVTMTIQVATQLEIGLLVIDDFSFYNQFWLLAAYLFGFNLSIQSNQPKAFKITFENMLFP